MWQPDLTQGVRRTLSSRYFDCRLHTYTDRTLSCSVTVSYVRHIHLCFSVLRHLALFDRAKTQYKQHKPTPRYNMHREWCWSGVLWTFLYLFVKSRLFCTVCDETWVLRGNKCYKDFPEAEVPGPEGSFQFCRDLGVQHATIQTLDDLVFLDTQMMWEVLTAYLFVLLIPSLFVLTLSYWNKLLRYFLQTKHQVLFLGFTNSWVGSLKSIKCVHICALANQGGVIQVCVWL